MFIGTIYAIDAIIRLCTVSLHRRQLLESRWFLAAVGSNSPTPVSLTYFAPEQNLERAFSAQVNENGTLLNRDKKPPRYRRSSVSKNTY